VGIFALLLSSVSIPEIGVAQTFQNPSAGSGSQTALLRYQMERLDLALTDLGESYSAEIFPAEIFRSRLRTLQQFLDQEPSRLQEIIREFGQLRREVVRQHPLLRFKQLLVVKRRPIRLDAEGKPILKGSGPAGLELGMPSNHECNSSLARMGYDNEITLLEPVAPEGHLRTVYRPPNGGYVGEIDLHFEADRLLFTQSDPVNWKIFELDLLTGQTRQVVDMPEDVDCMDACYLPDGGIVFASTACFQAVPCWHGLKKVVNLFRLEPDGKTIRRLCFDQDHDLHPVILPTGQILYNRWDYTGINHIYLRQLMVMNPDGTGQRAIYGSNSWFPNALYFARPLPSEHHRLIAVLSGYHGPHRMGWLVLVDFSRGWFEEKGIVARISGEGQPIERRIADQLVQKDWPRFLHPYPLSDKYFLVACQPRPGAPWGIYLADVFDNLLLLKEEPGWALLEPIPLLPKPRPPVIASRIVPEASEAIVYLHDIYRGAGLTGVPRGTVKRLRVIAYHFGYPGLAGPDLVGRGGPWEVMQILGTVPLEADGSAIFRVPANTPLAVQALDAEGKAVQLMRSWFSAMPGEKVSCVGCHETPAEVASQMAIAALSRPRSLEPWYGPPRGFSFQREVQPVLNRYCTHCHNGQDAPPDLRPPEEVPDYRGLPLSELARQRMHPAMAAATGGILRYSPAYEALLPYIRRVGIEDDVALLLPGEYHADTSPLVQLLSSGHSGVHLDREAWDRLITWIDLNAPCYGTWQEVFPVPEGMHQRRRAMWVRYGGPPFDPEELAQKAVFRESERVLPQPISSSEDPGTADSPQIAAEPWPRQEKRQLTRREIPLPQGEVLALVRIPSGECLLEDKEGWSDKRCGRRFVLESPLWMGAYEITNAQFRLFAPEHSPRYYQKRHASQDDQGLPLDRPRQPVVRVSWEEAMAFCQWLRQQTGLAFDLPTEEEWEYAARAGSNTPFFFGPLEADFSPFANLGDIAFGQALMPQITGGLEHLMPEGAILADRRYNDGHIVTAPVGSFAPNPWGLYDMHGNAAEWTKSTFRAQDGPISLAAGTSTVQETAVKKVVRGGSFFTPPRFARAGFRRGHPAWQRVFDVGFRVVVRGEIPQIGPLSP
jgi:formylglycine-generating enzyme required for sulfatase activity